MNPAHRQGDPRPGTQQQPASTAPVADYLAQRRPGVSVDGRYVVLPRSVLDHLPLPLQHQLAGVLSAVHQLTAHAPWPQAYRVNAIGWRPVETMVEHELREIGHVAELDSDGELVHRDRTGQRLTSDQLARPMPVSIPDPLFPSAMTETR